MAVNLLLSYAFHPTTDLAEIRKDLVCGRLMIDSGAFTAYTRGKPVDRLAYAEYLDRWSPYWDHAITLDVIQNPDQTAANTRWLHQRGLPVMPVFTVGMTLADFDAMIKDVGYVAVGGLVGVPAKVQVVRIKMLQRRAETMGGGIHALGIGGMPTLRVARPYSADSSSVSGAFQFGCITFFDGHTIRQISIRDRTKMVKHRNVIRSHGIDYASLVTAGQLPISAERQKLIQATALSFACADEYLKVNWPVPPPAGQTQTGTHLYSSVSGLDARGSIQLDRQLHTEPASSIPPVWGVYGRHHHCTVRTAA